MSTWGSGIETSSPPVLPIISPCVMYLRRSALIFPRTICLKRPASRSIFRTTAARPLRLGLGAAGSAAPRDRLGGRRPAHARGRGTPRPGFGRPVRGLGSKDQGVRLGEFDGRMRVGVVPAAAVAPVAPPPPLQLLYR